MLYEVITTYSLTEFIIKGIRITSYNVCYTKLLRKLLEEDFRADRFKNHHIDLRGNNDLLSLTRPDIIREIHLKYLEAGADIIETNTFNANAISQADYELSSIAYDLNKQAAINAREVVDKFT